MSAHASAENKYSYKQQKNVINSFKVISYGGKKNDVLKINLSRDEETHWNWKHVLNFIPFERAKSI